MEQFRNVQNTIVKIDPIKFNIDQQFNIYKNTI